MVVFTDNTKPKKNNEETKNYTEIVNEMINSDKVVIFSKLLCPYSSLARKAFEEINQKFTVIDLTIREDKFEILTVLESITGGRTVPRVFIDGIFIGGGSDVQFLHYKGFLKQLVDKTIDKSSIEMPKDDGHILECVWTPKSKKNDENTENKDTKEAETSKNVENMTKEESTSESSASKTSLKQNNDVEKQK